MPLETKLASISLCLKHEANVYLNSNYIWRACNLIRVSQDTIFKKSFMLFWGDGGFSWKVLNVFYHPNSRFLRFWILYKLKFLTLT